MKLKVIVLDRDIEFINRLAKAFQNRYEDRISLIMFSDAEMMYENLKSMRADVILADQKLESNIERIAPGTVIGRLGEVPDVNEIDGVPAICKYQNVENIYKSILSIYAEHSSNVILKRNDANVRVMLFTSVQGGCGTSSTAAAYALRCVKEGKQVFYLNLEKFGKTELYFSGSGNLSFSDVIYSLKSGVGNLPLKLESMVQTDSSGVDFFHTCINAYDMCELQDKEIETLITGISQMKQYDEIVIDYSSDMSERMVGLMKNLADRIVYISDGSAGGNGKFERFCEAVHVLEERNGFRILEKMVLLYNRYSSKNGTQLEKTAVPVMGGIHRFEGLTEKALVQEISRAEVIGRL